MPWQLLCVHDGLRLEGGHRFPACGWDESRTFVVDKHRTPLPGCDQLLLTKGRRIQRRQIGQAARCDRQPASLFDNNSAVYPAPNVLLPFSSVFAVAACRSILVPPARVCLACLPGVGRYDQSGGMCHRRTPLLLSGRCLSRRVALERGVCFSVPISCAPVTHLLRYALTDWFHRGAPRPLFISLPRASPGVGPLDRPGEWARLIVSGK